MGQCNCRLDKLIIRAHEMLPDADASGIQEYLLWHSCSIEIAVIERVLVDAPVVTRDVHPFTIIFLDPL